MKKFILTLVALALPFSLFFLPSKAAPVTPQQRTSHALSLLDKDGDLLSFCSGTVIGPHAVLTATHCLGQAKAIRMDLTRDYFNIITHFDDGRDHTIVLLDGPKFKYIDPFIVRSAKIDERVFFYGYGDEDYPAHKSKGKVYLVANMGPDDPSELDMAYGYIASTTKVEHGDSGAAIYGEDGDIIALVSYVDGGAYELDFPFLEVLIARLYDGT